MIDTPNSTRPSPRPRDPHVATHGKHRPETVGAGFLAAGLVGDPEHFQRVSRWVSTLGGKS